MDALSKSIQQNTAELANLCAAGAGDTPHALQLAKLIAADLGQLKEAIQTALVDKVVEDFMDVVTPLKVRNHFYTQSLYMHVLWNSSFFVVTL